MVGKTPNQLFGFESSAFTTRKLLGFPKHIKQLTLFSNINLIQRILKITFVWIFKGGGKAGGIEEKNFWNLVKIFVVLSIPEKVRVDSESQFEVFFSRHYPIDKKTKLIFFLV